MQSWTELGSEDVFSSEWICVKRNSYRLPGGNEIPDYYTVTTADAAMIVAIDREGSIILKEEYRCAAGRTLIEIPAGMIDAKDADPLEAARRELREETGYTSANWTYMGESLPDPTRMTNRFHLFLARDCRKTNIPDPDTNEEIRVLKMPLQKAVDMIIKNEISVGSSAHAILKAVCLIRA